MTISFTGINGLFLLSCLVGMAFVAFKPGGFIKVITLGRFTGADVPQAKLRRLQFIAASTVILSLLSFVIKFLINVFI